MTSCRGHRARRSEDDVVLLTVPADGGYLGVLRTATAGLAARLHFALDEIEDLRIAVDEACAMLLAIATRSAELDCRFAVTEDALTVEVTVSTCHGARLPAESSFAWKVLTALTTSASARRPGPARRPSGCSPAVGPASELTSRVRLTALSTRRDGHGRRPPRPGASTRGGTQARASSRWSASTLGPVVRRGSALADFAVVDSW